MNLRKGCKCFDISTKKWEIILKVDEDGVHFENPLYDHTYTLSLGAYLQSITTIKYPFNEYYTACHETN